MLANCSMCGLCEAQDITEKNNVLITELLVPRIDKSINEAHALVSR